MLKVAYKYMYGNVGFGFFLFLAKKYKKVTGKEIYSDTLESTPMLEKEKFPQDYFPEVCTIRGAFPVTGYESDCLSS